MKTFFKFLIIAVTLLGSFSLRAQNTVYPIQLNAVMLPPYTNCLGDYFNSGANRVQVKAILRDISRYDKSLKFSLSVKVKVGNTVVLESVTPYPIELSNANVINDLREYVPLLFSPAADNKGVRASGNYATNGYCLPEGSYEFVFQVFDFYKKNVPLSEPFSMFCYLNQAEAPVAVYPEDGACGIGSAIGISEAGVQFQWMDPIAYGPSNKMYEFVLTEKGSGSNLVGNMFSDVSEDNSLNLPVFSDKVYNNTFRYVPATSGTFVKGKEYCWYVVAKGGNITGEKDDHYAFKNKGKSNVNCFIYGDCPEKEKIFDDSKVKKTDNKLKVVLEKVDVDNDKKNAEATWKSETGDFCKYYVYYYRKDLSDASAEKAEIKDLTSLSTVLNNLEPGYEYSCYVIGATNCDKEGEAEVLSPKSNELSFKLDQQKEDDKCDADLTAIVCENLLEELNKKDYFFGTTSGEIVTVTEVTKNTDNSFTGKGIVSCSIFKNKLGFNVTFDNIFINTERYLCKGEVKVVHDDVDNLVINLNEAAGKKQGAEKAKQQEHLGTEINSLEEAKNYPNQMVIFKGELYAVDADGNYLVVGKVVEKDKLCPTPKGGLDNEDGTVLFDVEKGLNGDKYDPYIDKSPSPFQAELVKKSYEWQASTYPIAWVSMVEGEVRWITAELSGKKEAQSNLNIEDVDFYCYAADSSAVKLEKKVYGNKVMFKVYGGKKNTSLKIYARKNAEKVDGECPNNEKTLGVVNIYSMSHQTKKILLAPVLNEMTLDNLQQMQDDINKMFAPLGKTFEFTIGTAFTAQDEPELEYMLMGGINTADGAKHFSKETDEMTYIRKRYTQFASDYSDYDACLFLIPTAQKIGLQGYMPLNKRVGYIIVGENDNVKLDANTIAHELCHGLFDIQHVFDYKGVSEGALPENIMDYPELNSNISERYLTKYYQWVGVENGQLIHLSFLDDTEDAEFGGMCLALGLSKWVLGKAVEDGLTYLFNLEEPKTWDKYLKDDVFTTESLRSLGISLFDECSEQLKWKRVAGVASFMNSVYNMFVKCLPKNGCDDICNCYASEGFNIILDEIFKGLKIKISKKVQEEKKSKQNDASYDEKSLSERFVKWGLESLNINENEFKFKLGINTLPVTIEGAVNVFFKYLSQKGAGLLCPFICSSKKTDTPTSYPPTTTIENIQIMDKQIQVEVINEVVTVSVRNDVNLSEIVLSGGYDKNLKWPDDALQINNGMEAERNCSDNLNYAGGGSDAPPFKMEKINCISYTMYRFKLPACDKNPLIVTGYANTKTGELVEDWDFDKRDCGITVKDAMEQLKGNKKTNVTPKKEDTPKVDTKVIRISKKNKLRLYAKYCCKYVDEVSQYTTCDKKRQQEASCFLKDKASQFVYNLKSSLSDKEYALYEYMSKTYTNDELSSEIDVSYVDEYELVRSIYKEISDELKGKSISPKDFSELDARKKLVNMDKLTSDDCNVFNAIYLKANHSSSRYWMPQLSGPDWFDLLKLPLSDKSYCEAKNASCSDKSQESTTE